MKKPFPEAPAHSPIGASSCERWWNCPGSVELSKQAPEQPSSYYASQGTAAHTLCEELLTLPVEKQSDIGDTIEADGREFTVDDEMMEAAELYVETIQNDIERLGLSPSDLSVEQRFHLSSVDAEAFGTCDAVLVAPFDRIIVYDFKYGAGVPVNVHGNKQLLYYSLGAFWSCSEVLRDSLSYVESVVVQPRAAHSEGVVRRHVYTIDELLEFQLGLREAVGRIKSLGEESLKGGIDYSAVLEAGSWCKFCRAKPICPEVQRESLAIVNAQLEHVRELEINLVPKPQDMTPDQISEILNRLPILEDWCKSMKSYAFHLAEQGIEVPGYKLVDGRSNRKWVDEDAVLNKFVDEFGTDLYTKQKLISPAQLDKLLKGRKDEAEELWYKPTPKKSLAPFTDSRRTRKPAVEEEYAELDALLADC